MAHARRVTVASRFQVWAGELASAWRNSRTESRHARSVTRYVSEHVGECVLVAGGISFILGYLTVAQFAKHLRVAPSDLGLDAKAYVSIAGFWLLFGSILTASMLGGLVVGSRLGWWARRCRARDLALGEVLVIGALMTAVTAFGVIIWSIDGRRAAFYWMFLLGEALSIHLAGLIAGLVVRAGFLRLALYPLVAVAVVVGTAFAYMTGEAMLSEGRKLATYAMELAVEDEPPTSDGMWLSTFLQPTEGTVTMPDGTAFCGVRVTTGVFLRPPADPDRDLPDTVVVDGAAFVAQADGC